MGLIKEPLDVDFFVESRSFTQKERVAISQRIGDYNVNLAKRRSRKSSTKNKPVEGQERSAIRQQCVFNMSPDGRRLKSSF
jgi:hypothetical protein